MEYNVKHGLLHERCPICGQKVFKECWSEIKGEGSTLRTLRIIHEDQLWHKGCDIPFANIERPSGAVSIASGTNYADIAVYEDQIKSLESYGNTVASISLPIENPEDWGMKAASLPETTEEPEPEVEE